MGATCGMLRMPSKAVRAVPRGREGKGVLAEHLGVLQRLLGEQHLIGVPVVKDRDGHTPCPLT